MKKTALELEIIAKAQAKIDFMSACIMRVLHNEELSRCSKNSIIWDYYCQAEEYIAGMAETYWTMAYGDGTFNWEVYKKLKGYSLLMVTARCSNK